MFKQYIKTLENASMPPEVRIQKLIQEQDDITANINILSVRLENAIKKLQTLESK